MTNNNSDLNEVSLEKLLAYRKAADKSSEKARENRSSMDSKSKRKADRRDVWRDEADDRIRAKTGSDLPTLGQRIKAKMRNEEAPANAVGAGNIAGMGVGPDGEPGIRPKAMKRYKDKNAAEAPKVAGRKTFSQFMKGT